MGKRLVVLASGSGSNLQALLDRDDLGGRVELVVTDRPDARALVRASAYGVDHTCVAPADHADREAWQQALGERITKAEPDLVVLAGFMRILPGWLVRRWPMLNVHPSLLPSFPGAKAIEDALAHGVKVTGATVHFVVEEVDAGPIVAQDAVPVLPGDTAETLRERIQAVEHRLLPHAVAQFCRGKLEVEGSHVRMRL